MAAAGLRTRFTTRSGRGTRRRFGASALRRLLRAPAPDVAALAQKLELALDERSGEFFGDEAAMKAMKRDARRLAAWAA